jgi:hypothetical protein
VCAGPGRLREDRPGRLRARLGDDARRQPFTVEPVDGRPLLLPDDVGHRDAARTLVIVPAREEPDRHEPRGDEHEEQQQPGPEDRWPAARRRRWRRLFDLFLDDRRLGNILLDEGRLGRRIALEAGSQPHSPAR